MPTEYDKNSSKWSYYSLEIWLWKSEFCNLAGLTTSTTNVQKKFQGHFCDQWSYGFRLKCFYQIPLTWSKYYRRAWVLHFKDPRVFREPYGLRKPRNYQIGTYILSVLLGYELAKRSAIFETLTQCF